MTVRSANGHSDQADADPSDGRDETLDERMDRNWNEMLQELRVTLVGVGITLTGSVLLIFDVVLDRSAAVIAAAVIAVVLAAIAALPHILRDTPSAEFHADEEKEE